MAEMISRNVVMMPSGGLWPRINKLSLQAARELNGLFTLGSITNLPHDSLFQTGYPAGLDEKAVGKVLKGIADSTAPFQVRMTEQIEIFAQVWVWWNTAKNSDLISLHTKIVDALQPFRQGQLLPVHQNLLQDPALPPDFKIAIERYGNPLCHDTFSPHLTLTRAASPFGERAREELLPLVPDLTYRVDRIYWTVVGEHSTCCEVLADFPLRG